MRYLTRYKIFEDKQDIDSICRRYSILNYTIGSDGGIDVDGDVYLFNRGLSVLPLKFAKVSGHFNCSSNELTSLEGVPSEVGGSFICGSNQLTSLEGVPTKVVGSFNCSDNEQVWNIVQIK